MSAHPVRRLAAAAQARAVTLEGEGVGGTPSRCWRPGRRDVAPVVPPERARPEDLRAVNIADLVTGARPEHRDVGIVYEDRLHLVSDAKRIYLELGIACELHDRSISYAVPRHASRWYAGAFERLTGHPAFNEWDEPAQRE